MTETASPSPSDASPPRQGSRRRWIVRGSLGLLALLVVIQLVPYGRDHNNPAPSKQVRLATAAQRVVFTKACADCHSYDTKWLWYTNVAPVSWLVQSDINGGRERLNLSAWDKAQPEVNEVIEQISSGEMPPLKYWVSPYHWSARLSAKEKDELIAGFKAIYTKDPPPIARGGGG